MERKKIYNKRCIGVLLVQKSDDKLQWVKWVHEPAGIFHCLECLQLDGCWFVWDNAPLCPQHEKCHCRLEAIDSLVVLMNASTYSDYRKFDPYLFNTNGRQTHNKEILFKEWGYTVEDARWLQAEIERQAREKYISGEYALGRLNWNGQRISIRITTPRKDGSGEVSFITGWMVEPNGKLRLTTPYGGK